MRLDCATYKEIRVLFWDEVGMISYLLVLCMCVCVWHWEALESDCFDE